MWWRIAIVHTVHLQLIKSNRCFKCLKTGHQVKENQDSEKEIPENSRKKKSSSVTGSAVTTTSAIKTKGDILLHANRHSYSDKRRKHKVNRKTRISFDNGSQRSYITDSVKAKLSFKPTSYETLHLNTFLEKVYQKKKMPSRNFNLPLRSGKNECVKISALSFPAICSPHPPKIDIKEYSHLKDLHFADSKIDWHSYWLGLILGHCHWRFHPWIKWPHRLKQQVWLDSLWTDQQLFMWNQSGVESYHLRWNRALQCDEGKRGSMLKKFSFTALEAGISRSTIVYLPSQRKTFLSTAFSTQISLNFIKLDYLGRKTVLQRQAIIGCANHVCDHYTTN